MPMLVALVAVVVATSAAAEDVTWDYAKGTDFTRLKNIDPLAKPGARDQQVNRAVEKLFKYPGVEEGA